MRVRGRPDFEELTDVPAVIAWVGGDEHRALAARRWFDRCSGRGPGRADPEAHAAHRAAMRPWWRALRAGIGPILREHERREQMCASLEHRWPLCLGGGYQEENLAIAHRGCNTAAAGRHSPFARLQAAPDHARELLAALGSAGPWSRRRPGRRRAKVRARRRRAARCRRPRRAGGSPEPAGPTLTDRPRRTGRSSLRHLVGSRRSRPATSRWTATSFSSHAAARRERA